VVWCREAYPEYSVLDIKFAFNVSRLIALERERQVAISIWSTVQFPAFVSILYVAVLKTVTYVIFGQKKLCWRCFALLLLVAYCGICVIL